MSTDSYLALLSWMLKESQTRRERVFMVGGVVRDLLLGHEVAEKDVDFIVEGDTIPYAKEAARVFKGQAKEYPSFLTAKATGISSLPGIEEIDFAATRTEIYPTSGSLPKVTRSTIEHDLARRDFSINAIAVPLDKYLAVLQEDVPYREGLVQVALDPFKGVNDLDRKSLRILHSASFKDDPTRLFRGVRYKHRISGQFEEETSRSFSEAVAEGVLQNVSEQRKLSELRKISAEAAWRECLLELVSRRVLSSLAWLGDGLIEPLEQMLSSELLSRVSRQFSEKGRAAIMPALLAWSMAMNESSEQVLILKQGGITKKEISRLLEIRDEARSSAWIEASNEAVLLAVFLGRASREAGTALQKRGIVRSN